MYNNVLRKTHCGIAVVKQIPLWILRKMHKLFRILKFSPSGRFTHGTQLDNSVPWLTSYCGPIQCVVKSSYMW